MVVFLATAGCGVSVNDHLKHKDPFVALFFRFHTYYQIRKIIQQMGCPIPNHKHFNKWNNGINTACYIQIGVEFGLPQKQDFRYRDGNNLYLGTLYFGGSPIHCNSYVDHNSNWYFHNESPSIVNRHHMATVDKPELADYGWMVFMLQ
jgi:hypothetical protein